jgi:hypothetical protein
MVDLVRAAHLRAHDLVGEVALFAFLQDAHQNVNLDLPAWRELLFAAMELASDELKAALLLDVAPDVPREVPAREAYLIAAASIGSPELRQRALEAVSEKDLRDRTRHWLTFIGDVTFGHEFNTIEDVAAGSRLIVEVRDGQTQRKLEVSRQGDSLLYIYTVDGEPRPFDEHAEAWLERVLTAPDVRDKLTEHASIDPTAASAYASVQPEYELSILQFGLHHDEAGLHKSRLNTLRHAVEYAHESGDDGAVLTRLINLVHIAAHGMIDDETYMEYLEIALELAEPSPHMLYELLYAASELASEPLRAEFLLSLAPRLPDEPALRERYLASAATLSAEVLRQRVITALE